MSNTPTGKPARKIITAGISFSSEAEKLAAKAAAKARRQSLSAYLLTLLEADLRAQGCQLSANPAQLGK